MNLDTSIDDPGQRRQDPGTSLQSKLTTALESGLSQAGQRLRMTTQGLVETLGSKAPLLVEGWVALVTWTRKTVERLRHVDYGARSVQAVGTAVVLGTLYVTLWGTDPRPSQDAPEIVATRIAPIGTVILQDGDSPRMAEQAPASASSSSPM